MKALSLLLFSGLVFTLCVIGLSGVLYGQRTPEVSPTPLPIETPTPVVIDPDMVLENVNSYRFSKGLEPVKFDSWLCETGYKRLLEVRMNWSHDGFGGNRFCGNNHCFMGENLARDYFTPQSIVAAWISSPSHEEIMVTKRFKYGCVVTDDQYTVLHLSDVKI